MNQRHRPARPDDDLALPLVQIAEQAGRAIMELYRQPLDVDRKADESPVTEADRRAEEIILEALSRLAPGVPVLAEESAVDGRIPELGDRFFLVDPLDGTREFIGGRGEFTVNVALIEKGRPVAGIVHAPALGMYAVASGSQAFEARLAEGAAIGAAEWYELHTRAVPETGPVAVASRSHRDAETDAFLAARGILDTRSAGSSLKFWLVARGEADVYPRFGRTMEWDTGAGHAVLAAAGGAVVTVDGADLAYGKRDRDYDNPAFIAWGRRPGA